MNATDVTIPMPGDWLVIAGERLNTDPNPYGYGSVADWILEDQINTQTVTVGATVTEPDPKWIHVDTAGHAHAWASPPAGAPSRPDLLPAGPPWDSDAISTALGINPEHYARHTALGDVLWAEAIHAKVTGR